MLDWFRSTDAAAESSAATSPVSAATLEGDSLPAQLGGVLASTWNTGAEYGALVASGTMDLSSQVASSIGETAVSAYSYAGGAVEGIGRAGGTALELVVLNPAVIASRSAATVADIAIVKPARAISRFVLIALGIVCGSGVAIAGFVALALYFYHASGATVSAPPTIIVVPGGTVTGATGRVAIPQHGTNAPREIRAAAEE